MDEAIPAHRQLSAVLVLALAAGCAEVAQTPSRESAVEVVAAATPAPADVSPDTKIAAAPAKTAPTAKTAVPAKIPAKPVKSPTIPAASMKTEVPVPAAKAPEPPLDVAALTARLRDTSAIGVLSKLALRNQVDDLLKQFRAVHLGGQKTAVASLRQPYNMLLLKVLSLVQDSDPSLARAISGSREAIWGILADPEKFKLAA